MDCCPGWYVAPFVVPSSNSNGWKILYLSSFYKRTDLALRIGLFYTAASLSGAFGGKCFFFLLLEDVPNALHRFAGPRIG